MVGGLVLWLNVFAEGVILLAAAVLLIRHRRRSRRATGLALVAVLCLAGDWLFGVVALATWDWWFRALSDDTFLVIVQVKGYLTKLWRLGCVLLFVWAALADRHTPVAPGPEADYRDPPTD